MNIKDIVGMLPDNVRAEAEKVIGEAVAAGNVLAGIDTQEKAFELIKKTAVLKSAFDAEISKTVENHDKKFMEEKLPKLVDAEVKKLTGPETDPLKLELAQIRKELEDRKNAEKKAVLKSVALKIAADEKIPIDDIDRFIGEDENATAETVKAHAARMKAWANSQAEAILKEKLGNNGRPSQGVAVPPADLATRYQEALKDPKRADEALMLHEQLANLPN